MPSGNWNSARPWESVQTRSPGRNGSLTRASSALLSLAGMPLTAGFLGKFYVLAAGVRARIWLPVVVLVVTSTLGLFYYLRVIVAVYERASADPAAPPPPAPALPFAGALALAAVAVLLVALGVYPTPLLQLIRAAVAANTATRTQRAANKKQK